MERYQNHTLVYWEVIMPGTVTHLVIADKVINKLPKGSIKKEGYFYAGTIAPDSVLARADFEMQHKKLSHLKHGIPDVDFYYKEYYELFNSRLDDFVKKKIYKNNIQLDIELGYLVHLLADEIFLLTIYREMITELDKKLISEASEEFLKHISFLKANTDLRLINEYNNLDEIKNLLINVEPFELVGYLTEQEISRSLNWVIRNCLNMKKDYEETKIISYQKMNKFIDYAVDNITEYLKKLSVFN